VTEAAGIPRSLIKKSTPLNWRPIFIFAPAAAT